MKTSENKGFLMFSERIDGDQQSELNLKEVLLHKLKSNFYAPPLQQVLAQAPQTKTYAIIF